MVDISGSESRDCESSATMHLYHGYASFIDIYIGPSSALFGQRIKPYVDI